MVILKNMKAKLGYTRNHLKDSLHCSGKFLRQDELKKNLYQNDDKKKGIEKKKNIS